MTRQAPSTFVCDLPTLVYTHLHSSSDSSVLLEQIDKYESKIFDGITQKKEVSKMNITEQLFYSIYVSDYIRPNNVLWRNWPLRSSKEIADLCKITFAINPFSNLKKEF